MTNFEKTKQEISKMSLEVFSKRFHGYLCNKIPGEHCVKYPPTVNGPAQCGKCIIDWLKSEYGKSTEETPTTYSEWLTKHR